MARVSGEGVGKKRKFPSFPSPFPSFIFCLWFHFSRGQNRESRSSVFFLLQNSMETLATQATRRVVPWFASRKDICLRFGYACVVEFIWVNFLCKLGIVRKFAQRDQDNWSQKKKRLDRATSRSHKIQASSATLLGPRKMYLPYSAEWHDVRG